MKLQKFMIALVIAAALSLAAAKNASACIIIGQLGWPFGPSTQWCP